MTDNFVRQDPPYAASELVMLNAYLDHHRATLLQKVAGVNDADLRRAPIRAAVGNFSPTITLLGLVKHLAYVERSWFQGVFAGADVAFPWTDTDPDADWRVEADETTEIILNLYKAEVAKSHEVVLAKVSEMGSESAALESNAKKVAREKYTLRWIMFHMIEETARHNGHADIMCETIDGVTGE